MNKKLLGLSLLILAISSTAYAKKDKLVYAQLSDPKTLDPQNSTDQYSQAAIGQIYDRLFEINEKTRTVVPSLASSYKKLDNKTIEIKLKDGVKFSNGDPLTSEDVKFSLERAKKNPKVAHLYAAISEIEIIDPSTFKIILSEPFAPIFNHLSHKSSSILNKKAFLANEKDYFSDPIGTGPYEVDKWDIGYKLTLVANKNYHSKAPAIKTVEIRSVPEENSRIIGLETGEFDMVNDVPAISWKSLRDAGIKVYTGPSTTTTYVGLNNNSKSLSNKKLRQAIGLTIDKQAINDAIYLGSVQVANQFLSPVVFGYDENAVKPEHNVEKAKKIIKDNKLEGTKLKISVSSPERVQVATIIQDQLKQIGLDVEIELLEWGTFLNQTGAGKSDMLMMGWGPSTFDGDYGYYPNIHSKQMGSNGNRSFYNNPEVDKLLEMARRESDPKKRAEMYKKIQVQLNEDMPIIPLYHGNVIYGASDELLNVEPTGYPLFSNYEFK